MVSFSQEHENKPTSQSKELSAIQYESTVTSELLNHLSIESEFRGLIADFTATRYDKYQKKFLPDPQRKKIISNIQGVHILLGMLRPFFSKSATMNYLEKEDIYMLMKDFRNELKFVIGTKQQRELIGLDIIYRRYFEGRMTRHAFLNINRSLDGKELIALTQTMKSQEVVSQKISSDAPRTINPFSWFGRGSR